MAAGRPKPKKAAATRRTKSGVGGAAGAKTFNDKTKRTYKRMGGSTRGMG